MKERCNLSLSCQFICTHADLNHMNPRRADEYKRSKWIIVKMENGEETIWIHWALSIGTHYVHWTNAMDFVVASNNTKDDVIFQWFQLSLKQINSASNLLNPFPMSSAYKGAFWIVREYFAFEIVSINEMLSNGLVVRKFNGYQASSAMHTSFGTVCVFKKIGILCFTYHPILSVSIL